MLSALKFSKALTCRASISTTVRGLSLLKNSAIQPTFSVLGCSGRPSLFVSQLSTQTDGPTQKNEDGLKKMRTVTALDKRILVLTRVFKNQSEIPKYIDATVTYRKAMDRFNIIFSMFCIVCVFITCLSAAYFGKKQGKEDKDFMKRINEKYSPKPK